MKTLLLTLTFVFSGFLFGQPDNAYKTYNSFLEKYVSNSGKVNYKAIKQNKTDLNTALASLNKNTPTKSWSVTAKKAYWMNMYNAYTIKLIVDNYPTKSIKDISSPWDKKIVPSGSKKISLNDVEHKILRKMGDPRIHVGINCASVSCPDLYNKAFTSKNTNVLLTKLAKDFVNDKSKNIITPKSMKLSKIFDWFSSDFGNLTTFINKYSTVKVSAKAKKSYLKYNWSLNQ